MVSSISSTESKGRNGEPSGCMKGQAFGVPPVRVCSDESAHGMTMAGIKPARMPVNLAHLSRKSLA
jgi:hypothetical protein